MVLVRGRANITTSSDAVAVATEGTAVVVGAHDSRELGDLGDGVLQAHEPGEREVLVQRTGALQDLAASRRPRIVPQRRGLVPREAVAVLEEKSIDPRQRRLY